MKRIRSIEDAVIQSLEEYIYYYFGERKYAEENFYEIKDMYYQALNNCFGSN